MKPTEQKQNVFSLTVNKCDHPDVGIYRVQIDNGIDHSEQSGKLNVGGEFYSLMISTIFLLSITSKTKSRSC